MQGIGGVAITSLAHLVKNASDFVHTLLLLEVLKTLLELDLVMLYSVLGET